MIPCHVQAHLHAQELTLAHAADNPDKLTRALVEAQVDLNPHQVDAALFAFQNPLSKGAILADEVGLGKTIEAGLVATQHWAEHKRRILVLCPASLRTQWRDELSEKFFLPSVILDARALAAADPANPFDRGADASAIVIASYHFAAKRQELLMTVPWNLAILDEAHRLRNVYKGARIAERVKAALATTPKVLLTATPLQNSLLELYGLVSLIDDEAFGDQRTFTRKYSRIGEEGDRFEELRERLAPICHRTLRRQVVEYVSYTRREPLTQEFWPSIEEQHVYDLVSEYLRRDQLAALPNAQRSLITLVLRKLLASSTFAIAGALDTMVRRLTRTLREGEAALAPAAAGAGGGLPVEDEASQAAVDGELVDELVEEELDGALTPDDVSELTGDAEDEVQLLTRAELEAIRAEIADLEAFRDLAQQISENAKGAALLTALATAFARAAELGAQRKAVIFTESRRTQDYLVRLLSDHGYAGRIVRFSGTNNDPAAQAIYTDWRRRHAGSDRVTGSRAIDIRAALADTFRTSAEIMIATEAAAEGINLQFCSIVVNYDLPWNPQRVEQRIGRCHRYGQRNDVLVVNFLNRANAADQRVYELLAQKFKLFEGVFGASDEVLGAIESGVDIERRIAEIYQRCRTVEDIDRDFEQLRLQFADEIDSAMAQTRTKLIEHFDAQVHDRLRIRLDASRNAVGRHQDLLFRVMQFALADRARFDVPRRRIAVERIPAGLPLEAPRDYTAIRPGPDDPVHYLRPADPVAQWALEQALALPPDGLHVTFDYSGWEVTAAELAPLVGASGALRAVKLRIDGKDVEEHLLLAGATDDGEALSEGQMRRLMEVPASERRDEVGELAAGIVEQLGALERQQLAGFSERRATWLGGEYEKLDRWAQDERDRLHVALDEIEKQIKQCARDVRAAGTEAERLPLRRTKLQLERQRDEARREYDEAVARIDGRQQAMLDEIETALRSEHTATTLFTIRWTIR
ncbi:MAG TPA: SNF2-related protein [Conexibacter sp.]|nr:SNF2-related protein [Conexibacter sp.]